MEEIKNGNESLMVSVNLTDHSKVLSREGLWVTGPSTPTITIFFLLKINVFFSQKPSKAVSTVTTFKIFSR